MREAGFTETVYADDLNAFKEVPAELPNEDALEEAKTCQKKLHTWGRANQVSFDATKESFHVLSRSTPWGSDFKLLGVTFDCKLSMEGAVREVATEANWKLKALLRTSRFHYDAQLVDLYKSRLLGYLEYRTAAVYHATETALAPLDKVQHRFFQVLGCSNLEALMVFNLAPLAARRDVAMLGLLHRTVLGKGPAHFRRFFRLAATTEKAHCTRQATKRHPRQLQETRQGAFQELLRRSVLGLVSVYNLFPAELVLTETVPAFQAQLQALLKKRATAGCEDWAETLSPRVPLWRHPLR